MREWFADYLEACNRHDLDAVRELIDPSVRRAHLPGGVDAWISDLADLFQGFADWQWRRIQIIVEEDRLAVHLRASGTHTGIFLGATPTRQHVNIAEFGFLRLAKGRVVEYSGTAGNGQLLSQLG